MGLAKASVLTLLLEAAAAEYVVAVVLNVRYRLGTVVLKVQYPHPAQSSMCTLATVSVCVLLCFADHVMGGRGTCSPRWQACYLFSSLY